MKNFVKRFGITALAALSAFALACLASCGPGGNSGTIVVENATRHTMYEVFITPKVGGYWSWDYRGKGATISAGVSKAFAVQSEHDERWFIIWVNGEFARQVYVYNGDTAWVKFETAVMVIDVVNTARSALYDVHVEPESSFRRGSTIYGELLQWDGGGKTIAAGAKERFTVSEDGPYYVCIGKERRSGRIDMPSFKTVTVKFALRADNEWVVVQ